MKKIVIVLIIVITFGVLVITCPDEKKHKEVINQSITEYVQSELNNESDSKEYEVLDFIEGTLASGLISLFVNNSFRLDNYFIFSIGKISMNDEEKMVSFGILGHVFSKEINSNKD